MKKKSKVLAAAIAMMTLSTAASITGTVAWFTANNIVSVSGPKIQAEAEQGIVIAAEKLSAYSDADWGLSATALYSPNEKYVPTSTADASTWYHNNATNVDNYQHDTNAYVSYAVGGTTPVLPITEATGIGSGSVGGSSKHMYLVNKFYIQASAAGDGISGQDLFVNEVLATPATSTSLSLDKSIRVLFKATGGNTIIYAPLATNANVVHDNGTTDGHGGKIGGGDSTLTVYKAVASTLNARDRLFENVTIPGYIAAGASGKLEISVYLYFEGEDFNCKSSNITASLDDINVTFKFKNEATQTL